MDQHDWTNADFRVCNNERKTANLEIFLGALFAGHGHAVGVFVLSKLIVGRGGGESDAKIVQVDLGMATGGLSVRRARDLNQLHLETHFARRHAPRSARP